jgi:hypothetical protein
VAGGTFEQTSWGWQNQQLWQQVGEWVEQLFLGSGLTEPSAPEFPEWLLKGVFWSVVGGVSIWAVWQLYQLLRPYFESWRLTSESFPAVSTTPTQPEHSVTEWLQQARLAQQQGNYREACRALYQALLQRLSDRQVIPQDPARTDGEYLNLIQSLAVHQPYQTLISTHERLCFSDSVISAEVFDRCWQAYQEIDRQ